MGFVFQVLRFSVIYFSPPPLPVPPRPRPVAGAVVVALMSDVLFVLRGCTWLYGRC